MLLLSLQAVGQSSNFVPEIDALVWRLDPGSCSNPDPEWVQVAGPVVPLEKSKEQRTIARLTEYGDYEFELTCCNPSNSSPANRMDSLLSSPDKIGYGAATTGGAEASSYTVVRNLDDSGSGSLRDALLSANGPTWIVFDESIYGGTISLRSAINTKASDITIDGAGSGITVSTTRGSNHNLLVFRGGNTIIHGINFDKNRTDAQALMLREGKNYWIDHVTISNGGGDDAISMVQGSKGPNAASDITVSNYHVHNNSFGILGGGDDSLARHPDYRVTIHKSILAAQDRNPKLKNYATAHVFNNYIPAFRFSGTASGANSVMVAENNVYSAANANNPKMALSGQTNNGGRTGIVYAGGNLLLNGAGTSGDIRNLSEQENPIPYSYTLMNADEVVDYVLQNAGAVNASIPKNESCTTNIESFSYSAATGL